MSCIFDSINRNSDEQKIAERIDNFFFRSKIFADKFDNKYFSCQQNIFRLSFGRLQKHRIFKTMKLLNSLKIVNKSLLKCFLRFDQIFQNIFLFIQMTRTIYLKRWLFAKQWNISKLHCQRTNDILMTEFSDAAAEN